MVPSLLTITLATALKKTAAEDQTLHPAAGLLGHSFQSDSTFILYHVQSRHKPDRFPLMYKETQVRLGKAVGGHWACCDSAQVGSLVLPTSGKPLSSLGLKFLIHQAELILNAS